MKYKVTLNGKVYEIEVERGTAILEKEYEAAVPAAPVAAPAVVSAPAAPVPVPAAAPAPAPAAAPVTGEMISAPLPGNVVAIKVSAGQAVKKGDVLVVIEAMKMENEILAPHDATVTQILATVGKTVETGAPLVVLG